MLGTFGMRPKGTMSARAAGMGSALVKREWDVEIATVPWDNPADAGQSELLSGVRVANTRTVSPLRWPLAVRELIQISTRLRPDIIHLFKPKGFGDLAARYLQRKGLPVVVDMDDWEGTGGWNDALPYTRLQRSLFDWQERTWPARAEGITVASRTLEAYAHTLGANQNNLVYLPNQLTCDRFQQLSGSRDVQNQLRFVPNLGARTLRILLYTRFVEFSPEFVVAVLREVRSRFGAVELVIIGKSDDGRAEERLNECSRAAGVPDIIHNAGWISPELLVEFAAGCHVALVPFDDTRINRAKCSVKLLELLAAGIPIVASSVGENREYLARHGGGLLARPGDVNDHAERIITTFKNPGLIPRASFKRSGTWNDVVDQIEDMYERAMSKKS
jgi:glycosyltransferase involved in cell wall biosynthesis